MHAVARPTPEELRERGIRPPKPDAAVMWCEPCKEYVLDLIHRPASSS